MKFIVGIIYVNCRKYQHICCCLTIYNALLKSIVASPLLLTQVKQSLADYFNNEKNPIATVKFSPVMLKN